METKEKLAIYPGTFDPITNGHFDVLQRGANLFDKIVVAVTNNPAKNPLFSVDERISIIREIVKDIENVKVESFEGLLVDYAVRMNATAIVRGLRQISDFEYEFQMALINRKLSPDIATVFLMPNEKYIHLNSTIVKEVAKFKGDVSSFVTPLVNQLLTKKFD